MTANNCINVAIIQQAPVFLNIKESTKKATGLIEEAANKGANLIVFPETWLPGYPVWLDYSPNAALWDYPPAKELYRILSENSITIPGEDFNELLAISRKTSCRVVLGAHERIGGTLYNTMIFIDNDGKNYEVHRKLMPTYTERLIWGRGDGSTLNTLNTEFGKIGGLICWEHWMPLARAAMHAKHETVHVAQWPMVKELHQLASRHYAFEGQCYVIAAGCILSKGEIIEGIKSLGDTNNLALQLLEEMTGDKNDLILKGGSSVILPNSEYLIEPVYNKSQNIYSELDLEKITEGNLFLDTDGHYSRPDVFQLVINDQPQSNVSMKPKNKVYKSSK